MTMTARQAVQIAEDSRAIAVKRQDDELLANERQAGAEREANAAKATFAPRTPQLSPRTRLLVRRTQRSSPRTDRPLPNRKQRASREKPQPRNSRPRPKPIA